MLNRNANTALLVMDVQPFLLKRLQNQDEYLGKVTAAVSTAHQKHIPVVYIVIGFRPKAPEANDAFKQSAAHLSDPHPAIAPEDDDIVVVKRRVSAFSGSDLEVILRSQSIQHLVLVGIRVVLRKPEL